MKDRFLYLLLVGFKNNISVESLTREGLSYSEIADLIATAIEDGLLSNEGGEIHLSTKGVTCMIELEKQFVRLNKNQWIETENESKIPRIKINDVYLPNQNDLWFD